jgi:hypothetical protein
MNSQTASAALRPTVPADVLTFAREQGVEQYLPRLIAWAQQVYPSATHFEILVEDDPEIPNDRHIAFRLEVPLNLIEARETDRHWHEGVFRIVPAPLVCVFRLSVGLRS